MHVDECEITFNIGLSEDDAYRGSQLAFCGMFYAEDHRKHSFTYQHRRGWCVVHCGKHRHGALDIDSGERASLIIWTKSRSFRRTQEYRELADMAHWKTGEADTICLSYTHDDDYADLVPPDFHFQMRAPSPESPGSPGSPGSSPSREREPSLENLAWVRVCADNELEGRKLVQVGNREVAIFRHKGQLFALDDKCSHMGASLAGGDVEDLADNRCVVRCPGHGICFDLRTGESTKGAQQPTYPVRITERGIEVAVPHTRGVKRAAEDSLEESAQKA
ncbi:unnamed protein product [Effrenium voratum]|uniref:Rieske domain-containing protein n=1 Tax=Effrenium voratum TaxID=2562239 RepID=A0AA36JD48_9DINO|nr:unnamed protein product [Effrenium voratum]